MKEEFQAAFRRLDRILLVVAGVLLLLYLASGIYIVEAHQRAVVYRFGRAVAVAEPGIGLRWPWPIGGVRMVNVKEVRRLEAGFQPAELTEDEKKEGASEEAMAPYCLTGDKNVVHNRFIIQYRIEDPRAYLAAAADAEQVLYSTAQSAILEAVSITEVDPLLTVMKGRMELVVREAVAARLAALQLGIRIVGVERQSVEPPLAVRDAFRDVVTAQEEKRTRVHEAENYSNQEIPQAHARAHHLRSEAESYRTERMRAAAGEAERFLKVDAEFRAAPAVTRNRLFVEMIEEVLPRVRVVVLATDAAGKPSRLKLIETPAPAAE